MVPATVTGYEPASLGSGAGEGPEPSRWHFLYNDLAFLGGDGHPFLVVPSPAVLDFGDLRGTGISNAVLPYSVEGFTYTCCLIWGKESENEKNTLT